MDLLLCVVQLPSHHKLVFDGFHVNVLARHHFTTSQHFFVEDTYRIRKTKWMGTLKIEPSKAFYGIGLFHHLVWNGGRLKPHTRFGHTLHFYGGGLDSRDVPKFLRLWIQHISLVTQHKDKCKNGQGEHTMTQKLFNSSI